jgi:ribose 5-phosphate isomerase A
MDAPFSALLVSSDLTDNVKGLGANGVWEVGQLGRKIKSLVGVLEVGLFYGRNGMEVTASGEEGGGQKPVAAYFGMEDGSVLVRNAQDTGGLKTKP